MQVIRLPRQITRAAATASRLGAGERSDTAARRDAVAVWRRARAQGMSAAAAAQVAGVPRSTLYRWSRREKQGRLAPLSRRPHSVRKPRWTPALAAAVEAERREHPTWGKDKIAHALRRQDIETSASTVGRILKALVKRGRIRPVAELRRKAPRAARRNRPHAKRLPKGRKPEAPGEIVQLDTLTVSLGSGRPIIKQFTAYDPVAKWTAVQLRRNATANAASRFLDKMQAEMPFPIKAIQVDGGAEFKAEFEAECKRRNIDLWVLPPRSPKLNGAVERNNRTWRYEFYAAWQLDTDCIERIGKWADAFAHEHNTTRPHHALDGLTPAEYLDARKRQTENEHKPTQPSQMS